MPLIVMQVYCIEITNLYVNSMSDLTMIIILHNYALHCAVPVCHIEITNLYVNSISDMTMIIILHNYALHCAASIPH